jgi:hypothetical protein
MPATGIVLFGSGDFFAGMERKTRPHRRRGWLMREEKLEWGGAPKRTGKMWLLVRLVTMKKRNYLASPLKLRPRPAWHELRVCLFVEKLEFPFGEISKSIIENECLFYFGKSGSRHAGAWSRLEAFSRRLYSNEETNPNPLQSSRIVDNAWQAGLHQWPVEVILEHDFVGAVVGGAEAGDGGVVGVGQQDIFAELEAGHADERIAGIIAVAPKSDACQQVLLNAKQSGHVGLSLYHIAAHEQGRMYGELVAKVEMAAELEEKGPFQLKIERRQRYFRAGEVPHPETCFDALGLEINAGMKSGRYAGFEADGQQRVVVIETGAGFIHAVGSANERAVEGALCDAGADSEGEDGVAQGAMQAVIELCRAETAGAEAVIFDLEAQSAAYKIERQMRADVLAYGASGQLRPLFAETGGNGERVIEACIGGVPVQGIEHKQGVLRRLLRIKCHACGKDQREHKISHWPALCWYFFETSVGVKSFSNKVLMRCRRRSCRKKTLMPTPYLIVL